MGRHVARAGNNRSAYNVLAGKPEGKGLLGRFTRWWDGNIKMDYKQTGWKYVGWIYLAQARDRWQTTANAEMNLWVLWSAKNFVSSGSPVSFSKTSYFLAVSFESNFQQRLSLLRMRDCANVKWLNLFLSDNNRVFIKSQRLRWAAHVMRMKNTRTTRKLTEWMPYKTRPAGRPRLRWMDQVEEDLKRMKIIGWRAKVEDRQEWNRIVEQTKTHPEL